MKNLAYQLLLTSIGLALALGCGGDPPLPAPAPAAVAPLPYERVAVGGPDRADNGPDDSTVMDAIKGTMGSVKFSHFTHASNTEKGRGIPCAQCHHKTDQAKDPEEGCAGAECHGLPGEGADPAHGGAEDTLFLRRIQKEAAPVAFNHFTHASSNGYKLACSSCHHTGDLVSCTSCHKELPTTGENGAVVVKAKRAFHKTCQGCHQSLRQTKPDSPAPVACKDCHQDRVFETPVEGLTLNRALHLSCTHCHELVLRSGAGDKGPIGNCEGCHTRPAKDPEPTFAALAGEKAAAEPKKVEEIPRDPELEKNKGPEQMVIDHAKKEKSGTPFPHHAHQELGEDCYTCHHRGLKDPTCRTCHTEVEDAKKIYHANCITCHKENKIPAKCKDCHP